MPRLNFLTIALPALAATCATLCLQQPPPSHQTTAAQFLSSHQGHNAQVIQDSGFESGLIPYHYEDYPSHDHQFSSSQSPWSLTYDGAINPSYVNLATSHTNSGNYSLYVHNFDAASDWSIDIVQEVSVVPKQDHTLEIWAKQSRASVCRVEGYWREWENVVVRFAPARHWTKVRVPLAVGEVGSGIVGVSVVCDGEEGEVRVWLDDVTLTVIV